MVYANSFTTNHSLSIRRVNLGLVGHLSMKVKFQVFECLDIDTEVVALSAHHAVLARKAPAVVNLANSIQTRRKLRLSPWFLRVTGNAAKCLDCHLDQRTIQFETVHHHICMRDLWTIYAKCWHPVLPLLPAYQHQWLLLAIVCQRCLQRRLLCLHATSEK